MTGTELNSQSIPPSGAIETSSRFGRHAFLLTFGFATLLSLVTAMECHSIFYLPSLLYGLVYWEWWAVILILLWSFGGRGRFLSNISLKIVVLHILIASFLGVSHLLALGLLLPLDQLLGFYRTSPVNITGLFGLNRFGMELLLYGFASGVVGVLQAHMRSQQETLRALDLQRQLTTAQLQALQTQMEPHFLFNTLNAVTSLVDLGRNREASETLGHLNTILRQTLHRRRPEKIPFSEELRLTESYLAIQQMRFSDRLKVQIDASEDALRGMVPCFLLQPLVENAVRHGITPFEMGGTIEAHIHRLGDQLHLQVRDSGGIPKAPTSGHGIGLHNTRERLAHFYPEAHQFSAGPLPDGGFEVTICIPYEPAAL